MNTAPAAPIILVTTAHPSLHHHPGPDGEAVHPRLGRLLQPRHLSSVELTAAAGIPWACDNDCFQGLNEVAFVKMIDRVAGLPGCLFVTVPDVVGDAAATFESFDRWAPELERRELPLGLVAQDGMTVADLEERAPRLAALFIGGSTEWKEGEEAAELAIAAKRLGLWVHWGRVNTRRRFDLIVKTGAADSFDGSKWARFRNTYLDAGLGWLVEAAGNRRDAIAAGATPIITQATQATQEDLMPESTRSAADLSGMTDAFGFVKYVETTDGPSPVNVRNYRSLEDAIASGHFRRAAAGEVAAGDVVLVRGHGRVRVALVTKTGPKRAGVRFTTPTAAEPTRLESSLDEVIDRLRRRAVEASTPTQERWAHESADEVTRARQALEARGITGRDAVVAWATTTTNPTLPYGQVLVPVKIAAEVAR